MLAFDPVDHRYTWHGAVVPSVTQLLQPVADDFSMVPAATLEAKRALGVAVHKAIELDLQGVLDEDSLHVRVAEYFDGWRRFRRDYPSFRAQFTERPLYSKKYGYAGTADLVGWFGAASAVVDIKNTYAIPRHVGPQTAAYAQLVTENHFPIEQRACLWLKPNGYQLIALNDPADTSVFMSCLTIHRFRSAHAS